MEALWQDLRYAVRSLRKQPAFAGVVVFTVALGVGANTAIFSLTNALLLRAPQGVTEPEEIVLVGRTFKGADFNTFSYPDYKDFRDQNTSFADLAAYRATGLQLTSGASGELLSGMLVSGNYFTALGVRADFGRTLTPADDSAAGASPVVVISHGLWERRFGSDRNIAGKVIHLNNFPFTILGVIQEGFTGTGVGQTIDVWLPLAMYSQADPILYENRFEARQINWLSVLGRLKSDVTVERAQSEMTVLSGRLGQIYPDTDKGFGVALTTGLGLPPQRRDEARTRMGILLAIAGLVLLIVCANVANLLLAKGSARRKELALRQALGAGRARLIRQLLTEALVTSTIGGVLGIILAFWSRDLLVSSNLVNGVRLSPGDLRFDVRVLFFALLVSLATGLIFGLIPALEVSSLDLQLMLKDRSPRGPQRSRFRSVLVVGQIALSFVVLICSGLFVKTLRNAESIQPGFDTDRVLLMPIDVGRRGYSEEQGRSFYKQLVDRVRTVPGVNAASLAITPPLSGSWRTGFRLEGQPTAEPDIPCDYNLVAPRYFETAGIPLVSGRDFVEQDTANSPAVVIVNEEFARRLFPHDNPLAKRLAIPNYPGDNTYSEIIGVARDIKYERLTELPRPYFYQPLSQHYQSGVMLLVRARSRDASALTATVLGEVRALDRGLPVYVVRTLGDRLRNSLAPQRSAAMLLGVFGLLALALAVIGLYGVLAYTVGQRRQEIGVRMALGANSSDVLKLVFKQGAILIIGGVVIGLLIALAATRGLTSLLYEVSAADPLTYAVVTMTLVATALVACYIPARRATKVDPLVALRCE